MSMWNTQLMSALKYAFSALERLPHRFRTKMHEEQLCHMKFRKKRHKEMQAPNFFMFLFSLNLGSSPKTESTIGKAKI